MEVGTSNTTPHRDLTLISYEIILSKYEFLMRCLAQWVGDMDGNDKDICIGNKEDGGVGAGRWRVVNGKCTHFLLHGCRHL